MAYMATNKHPDLKGGMDLNFFDPVKRLYRISAGVLNGAQNGTWNIVITI